MTVSVHLQKANLFLKTVTMNRNRVRTFVIILFAAIASSFLIYALFRSSTVKPKSNNQPSKYLLEPLVNVILNGVSPPKHLTLPCFDNLFAMNTTDDTLEFSEKDIRVFGVYNALNNQTVASIDSFIYYAQAFNPLYLNGRNILSSHSSVLIGLPENYEFRHTKFEKNETRFGRYVYFDNNYVYIYKTLQEAARATELQNSPSATLLWPVKRSPYLLTRETWQQLRKGAESHVNYDFHINVMRSAAASDIVKMWLNNGASYKFPEAGSVCFTASTNILKSFGFAGRHCTEQMSRHGKMDDCMGDVYESVVTREQMQQLVRQVIDQLPEGGKYLKRKMQASTEFGNGFVYTMRQVLQQLPSFVKWMDIVTNSTLASENDKPIELDGNFVVVPNNLNLRDELYRNHFIYQFAQFMIVVKSWFLNLERQNAL